jgi:Protein of unknown function (DUF3775)
LRQIKEGGTGAVTLFSPPAPEEPTMLEIAPEKVAHVIIKAREYDSKVATWDDSPASSDAEDDPASILEDFANDPTRAELVGFINALNVDEQVNLVALAWIGRGTFGPEDLDEAVETARSERVNATSQYLIGMPLLADYLEEGLEKLGISVEDAESDIL